MYLIQNSQKKLFSTRPAQLTASVVKLDYTVVVNW